MKELQAIRTLFPRTRAAGAIVAIAVLLLLNIVPPAHAATLGQTAVGTIPSAGLTANFKRGSKFALAEAGTIESVCAYLDGNGGVSGNQQVRFAVYRDTNGVPGQKVGQSNAYAIASGTVAAWTCLSTGYVPLSAGSYWLVIHSGTVGGVVRDYYDGDPNWFGNADVFSDGASASFGSGNAGNGTLSIYAFVTPATDLAHAGRWDIAATPSKGLSANYKRGSKITLTQPGRLAAFSVYLDGNGGTSGAQDMRLVLYADANGVPGSKVADGPLMNLASGTSPRWFNVTAPALVLNPGNYWLVIHTGNAAGVLRDYGDGPANFYANADSFADGASQSFGPGSAGTGTLSAFISYTPGTFTTKTFGRTDVATVPSKGMTANFKRGSWAYVIHADAMLTGLYAYLDGRGGAAGSQRLRMAVYTNSKQNDEPLYKLAESEVVTIPAGAAPGWVHFPVRQPASVNFIYGVWIVIHSGDTGGVARNYGDGAPSWFGNADAFADGTAEVFGSGSHGTGTLSVYGAYSTRGN
jgi:hypothetical protein